MTMSPTMVESDWCVYPFVISGSSVEEPMLIYPMPQYPIVIDQGDAYHLDNINVTIAHNDMEGVILLQLDKDTCPTGYPEDQWQSLIDNQFAPITKVEYKVDYFMNSDEALAQNEWDAPENNHWDLLDVYQAHSFTYNPSGEYMEARIHFYDTPVAGEIYGITALDKFIVFKIRFADAAGNTSPWSDRMFKVRVEFLDPPH